MKKTKRQLQAEATKKKIYRVSIELFEKNGFEKLKISDICNKAGVSTGSFYNYYKSKSDILNEVFNNADDYFRKIGSSINNKSSIENILIFFNYYAEYNEFVGVDTMAQLYKYNNDLFVKKDRYMQNFLTKIIEEGQEKFEIAKDMTAKEICDYLFITIRGVCYDWTLNKGNYSLNKKIENYLRRLIEIFKV